MASWQREKSKMMELFSSRLDLLHSHQASTLQELQMARLEMGRVQEMLRPPEPEEEPQEVEQEEVTAEASAEQPPLEGAQARLQNLKESLFKREREISQYLEGDEDSPYTVTKTALLNAVVQKAHYIYGEVAEAKALVDQMAEENRDELAKVKETLDQADTAAYTEPQGKADETDSQM
ncbi:uncharacterized protein LOC121715733 [Alosa sapidissima]|uniref:uncharacterized protein LOC121715733 n=1 Tax=Alosa sapidissima TaxID=34773 RepID=UPI001C08399A|nr:uncharacterized protein LOC121715733 [Alosa sapidissima]